MERREDWLKRDISRNRQKIVGTGSKNKKREG